MNKQTVVHITAGLHPSFGGPSRTVVQLTDALAKDAGTGVTLLSQGVTGEPAILSNIKAVNRLLLESSSALLLKLGLPLRQELNRMAQHSPSSLIHSHGVWLPVNHWASRIARRYGIPLIIHPRGMLEPWALDYKAWKKRIAMALYQRSDLEAANVLVATSAAEYENLRMIGLRQPIAIIPNGVQLDVVSESGLHPVSVNNDKRTVLFLSRIHPKKGLLNLVQAWTQLAPQDWRLCLAGPNEGGHLNEVMDLVREKGITESVEYVGELDGENKASCYRGADLFVLPTYSENFGVVVAEALAYGLPVITTRGAPWADLETYNCGWWIDIGVEPLARALREAMALSEEERRAMGERGMEYVRRYDWDDIARQMIDVYLWVLGQGEKPDCVYLDGLQ
jgi:glycosyltransferase involved in cell wall biosynthesis